MPNRNAIKWTPFNSVINGNYIMNMIVKEKSRIVKPDLSEEQINKESLINKSPLEFTIYDNGYTKNIKGTVTKIDSSLNKIFLNYNNHIFFCEIMNVKKLDYFLS